MLGELAAAPDPDMALNNLERLASQGERAALFRLLETHPGALHLLAKLGGTSQFLADTLRRRPTLLPWLLEPDTMRQWLADELETELEQSVRAFDRPEARWNALRRFKYPKSSRAWPMSASGRPGAWPRRTCGDGTGSRGRRTGPPPASP